MRIPRQPESTREITGREKLGKIIPHIVMDSWAHPLLHMCGSNPKSIA